MFCFECVVSVQVVQRRNKKNLVFFSSSFIKWNFTKFLVNREGKPVKRYAPNTEPLVSRLYLLVSSCIRIIQIVTAQFLYPKLWCMHMLWKLYCLYHRHVMLKYFFSFKIISCTIIVIIIVQEINYLPIKIFKYIFKVRMLWLVHGKF